MTAEYWQLGEVEVPDVVPIQMIPGKTGTLGIVESRTHGRFSYERFYFLTGLSTGSERGAHAHKHLRQILICLRGAVTVELKTPRSTQTFRLASFDEALVLPPGYWRNLTDFSPDALIGVLASAAYDEDDYIRDWAAFADWDRRRHTTAVPYLDLARYAPMVGHAVASAMREAAMSGQLIGGREVAGFEQAFANYCTAAHAVGVGNGLQALTLALRAAGVGPGDEVILPANTFIATALAVVEAGATPVLVDVEAETGLISVDAVQRALTERTAAIIPVHLYGHPADMDRLAALTSCRPIFMLEDAAQAHGALYKGRRCGALGHAAAFSFYPTKNLGAMGDAGAVTTNDPALAARIRLAGNYGSDVKYEHAVIGTNSRLDPVQAAALRVKLPCLDRWNATRAAYAQTYLRALSGLPGLMLPVVHEWASPVWHVFAVRITGGRRPQFLEHMRQCGIGTNIHYPRPIHLQECFKHLGLRRGSFPVSEMLADQLVSLPLDPTHRPAEIRRVIDAVQAFFAKAPAPAPAPAPAEAAELVA